MKSETVSKCGGLTFQALFQEDDQNNIVNYKMSVMPSQLNE